MGYERTPFSAPAAVARVPLGPPEVWDPPRANLPRPGARAERQGKGGGHAVTVSPQPRARELILVRLAGRFIINDSCTTS